MDKFIYLEKDIGSGGYIGQSMSVRAKRAYDIGEMPKSKWTKEAMLDAIEYESDEEVANFIAETMTKKQMFDMFFHQTSWHHTGALYNETAFYSIDTKSLDIYIMDAVESGDLDASDNNYADQLMKKASKRRSKEEQRKKDYEVARKVAEEVASIEDITSMRSGAKRVFVLNAEKYPIFRDNVHGVIYGAPEDFDKKYLPYICTVDVEKVIQGIIDDGYVGACIEKAMSQELAPFEDLYYDKDNININEIIAKYGEVAEFVEKESGEKKDAENRGFRIAWNAFYTIWLALRGEPVLNDIIKAYDDGRHVVKAEDRLAEIVKRSDLRKYEIEYE